jgi:hypothetical protein
MIARFFANQKRPSQVPEQDDPVLVDYVLFERDDKDYSQASQRLAIRKKNRRKNRQLFSSLREFLFSLELDVDPARARAECNDEVKMICEDLVDRCPGLNVSVNAILSTLDRTDEVDDLTANESVMEQLKDAVDKIANAQTERNRREVP